MKVLMLLQLLFFSNLMIDVCGHICFLNRRIGLLKFEMSGEVQILQDAPTEPSPHTSLLNIPPL